MADYKLGDIVSISRSKTVRISVLTTPVDPELYTVGFPVGGIEKLFSFQAEGGETVNQIVAGLEAILTSDQTPYSAAVDGFDLFLVGPIGLDYALTVTDNLTYAVEEEAFTGVDNGGRQLGPLKVIEAESTLAQLREFSTRIAPGAGILTRNLIRVRELNSGSVLEVFADQILTVLERAP